MNYLYYGDNLDVLRRHIKDESVDLVYLDPPFNSKASYNVLFAEHDGTHSKAQIKAFEDTWHWDEVAAKAYADAVEGGGKVADALRAFRTFLGGSDMLAYLSMMAPRLMELRRVLKPAGSLYLHCDPTASHYLKLLLDGIFGPTNFQNEIVWKRTPFSGSSKARATRFPVVHDVLLFYSRTPEFRFSQTYLPYSEEYKARFGRRDERGAYQSVALKTYSQETFERLKGEGRLIPPQHPGAHWRYRLYLEELPGRQVEDLWTDINMINPMAKERLGYPTQKPEALLERIIQASSAPGDVVLDPFCGCGTAVCVAQRLGRRWIGVDITHLAIGLIKTRLHDAFAGKAEFKTIGEPTTEADARTLAAEDPYQFQWWTLGLVGARPVQEKKGADRGIDGRLYFHEGLGGETKQVILSVKAGHTQAAHVRDLRGAEEREKAEVGVLVTLEEPTREMRKEAASAGFYESPWGKHPRLQLFTVRELLEGKRINYPPSQQVNVTYKRAPKAKSKPGEQISIGLEEPDTED